MNIAKKGYYMPLDERMRDFDLDKNSFGEKMRKALGVTWGPSKKFYSFLTRRLHNLGTKGILNSNIKIHGEENVNPDDRQIIASNHIGEADAFFIETAVSRASKDHRPIPAPALPKHALKIWYSPFIQELYAYPIYSKDDGNIIFEGKKISKKELSLMYSEYCLLNPAYERILIFPTGEMSQDGKQIKGFGEGGSGKNKRVQGRLGAIEICWRAFHHIHEKGSWEKGKRVQIIPTYLSYYPLDFATSVSGFLKNLNQESKIRVRFGKPMDNLFQNKIEEFYSLVSTAKVKLNLATQEEMKLDLQKNFMDNLMDEIGKLLTINMNHLGSRIIYNYARNKRNKIPEAEFLRTARRLVGCLKEEDGFYFSEHFDNYERFKSRFDFFISYFGERKFFKKEGDELILNLEKIISEPEYKVFRKKNLIRYNCHLIGHLDKYLEIEKAVLSCQNR